MNNPIHQPFGRVNINHPAWGSERQLLNFHWEQCNLLLYLGVSIVMGVPQKRWMVFVGEDPMNKWMMTGGTPIYGNPHLHEQW